MKFYLVCKLIFLISEMTGEVGLANSRSRREKPDKFGRLAALKKLKGLKGTKHKYEVSLCPLLLLKWLAHVKENGFQNYQSNPTCAAKNLKLRSRKQPRIDGSLKSFTFSQSNDKPLKRFTIF